MLLLLFVFPCVCSLLTIDLISEIAVIFSVLFYSTLGCFFNPSMLHVLGKFHSLNSRANYSENFIFSFVNSGKLILRKCRKLFSTLLDPRRPALSIKPC